MFRVGIIIIIIIIIIFQCCYKVIGLLVLYLLCTRGGCMDVFAIHVYIVFFFSLYLFDFVTM
jgi:hypothetical protein